MRKILAGLLCCLFACQPTPNSSPPQEPPGPQRTPAEARKPDPAVLALIAKHGPDVPALVQGNSDFGLALYQRLASKDGNLFFSPYSISNALAMTYAGARGNTAREMKATLRFQLDDDRLHPAFGNLIAQLHGADAGKPRPFQLTVANRLWGQKDYGFQPSFLKIGDDFYQAGLEEVDYKNDYEGARKTINAWVEKKTKDKIVDLIPEGELDALTRLVLTNAIYFKGVWLNPFPKQTQPGPFHLASGKTVQTPIMQANPSLNFAQHDSFSMVELPYENNELSMVVLLPKKKDGLRELEKQLTAENLAVWMNKLSGHDVDLKLPKFEFTAEFKLNEVLKEMGIRDAFDEYKANFSGIATREQLYVSAVLHKAFVDVNEEGTEAAAATAVVVSTKSEPTQATFHADHPFVFLIREQRSGSILFLGRVANPVP